MTTLDSNSQKQLKSIIDRIEHLESEKHELADEIKEVLAEAKGSGFDVPAIKQIVRMRAKDKTEREEQEAILETYLHALGMI